MNKGAFDDLTLDEEIGEEDEFDEEDQTGVDNEEEKKEDDEEDVPEFKYDRALYDPGEVWEDEEVDFDDE